jgi:branched-subunit amino acid ABC-type transport system permease component
LFLLGLVMYLAAGFGIVFFLRRRPVVSIGLAIWIAALLPTQSFVPKLDALTNRPLSLALVGLLIAVAPLIGAVLSRVQWRALVGRAAAAMLFTALAIETSHRAVLFQSPLDLWRDAASKSRDNERPHVNYALQLRQEGRDGEALQELTIAARIDPFSPQIDTMLRVLRSRQGTR